jgi:hypothetical protein
VYEHLAASVPYWPEGLEGLQPLYQAVARACQGGRHEEARAAVYRDRILRGNEHYNFWQLGAFGAELGALGWFFEERWKRVAPNIAEADKGWLLSLAGFCLCAVGRLTEALEPMRSGLAVELDREHWKSAAISADNLSELELTLGDVAGALRHSRQSVEYAEKSGDASQRTSRRTTLAHTLHQTGERNQALTLFCQAEKMQAAQQPQYPLLYSMPGFKYCDLLLAGAERAAWIGAAEAEAAESCRSVAKRANQTLQWIKGREWLLDLALDQLTLGCAELYVSVLDPSDRNARARAATDVNAAVQGLRASGHQGHLPRGLLSRGWLRALEGNDAGACADLDEAWEIAERGPMRLFMADVRLYRARLFRDREELREARRVIIELGYGRRAGELEDAEHLATLWTD